MKKSPKLLMSLTRGDLEGVKDAIGFAVIPNVYGIHENRASVLSKMAASEIDPENLDEISEKTAFIQAIKSLDPAEKGVVLPVDDPYLWVTYQLNSAKIQDADECNREALRGLNIQGKAIVRYYKPGRSPRGGDIESDNKDLEMTVMGRMTIEQTTVRTHHITRMIESILKTAIGTEMLNLRSAGGSWYVPTGCQGLLERIQAFIELLNGSQQFIIIPISGKESNRRAVWKAVVDDAKIELANLRKKREDILKTMDDPGKTLSSDTPQNALTRFEDQRNKVVSFAEFLQMQGEAILAEIDREQQEFKSKLSI